MEFIQTMFDERNDFVLFLLSLTVKCITHLRRRFSAVAFIGFYFKYIMSDC